LRNYAPSMAFSISDYRNIPSSGIIPVDDLLPADQFSFAYTFIYEKDVNLEEGFSSDFDAHITLQIKDSAGNLKATFDAFETYHVVLFPLAPGLAFYTWNWDINKEKFTASDGAGNPIGTEGQFSLGAIPASDSGTTDKTAIVSSTFYSSIFNLDIEEGDTLKITFHNASAGYVTDKASLKIATRQVDTRSPALFDLRCGQQIRVFNFQKQVRAIRSRHQFSPLLEGVAEWAPIDGSSDGLVFDGSLKGLTLARARGCIKYVIGKDGAFLRMFSNRDQGKDWTQIMAITNDVTPLASCLSNDASTFFIYGINSVKEPSFVILKNSNGVWKINETGICVGSNLPITKVNALERSGGQLRLLATGADKQLLLFSSSDGKKYTQEAVS
jgi:hypothetical protein